MLLDPELPDRDALAPWLIKLAAHPGSAVVVTIEHRRDTNVPDVRMGGSQRRSGFACGAHCAR